MQIEIISFLTSSDQTAYVQGRYIGESVRLTSDLIEFTHTHNVPRYLLIFDIEKAFDSVDSKFLCSTLKKTGFGNNFFSLDKNHS